MLYNKSVISSLLLTLLTLFLSACGDGGFGSGFENASSSTTSDFNNTVVRIGSGSGDDFSAGVLSAASTNLSAGASTKISATLVDQNNTPYLTNTSRYIKFTSECASQGLAVFEPDQVLAESGGAETTYTATGCTGEDVVKAEFDEYWWWYDEDDTPASAYVELSIAADEVLALEFVSNSESNLSIKGAGGNEVSTVTFRLVGLLGAPIIGETISFEATPETGGATLATDSSTDVSDSNGEVSTIVQSGSTANTINVVAKHEPSGVTGVSEAITISTGLPVANRFSLSVSESSPSNAFDTNGIIVTIGVTASDQFGNPVPDGTNVSFHSPEAGQIESNCQTVDGNCEVEWESSDRRPSDYRASIVATILGAEAFTDTNGNNVYDTGDSPTGFTDLPRDICIDLDENLICDPSSGDYFIDTNLNGVVDGPDGVWNGPCLASLNDEAILTSINETAICNTPSSTMISTEVVISMPSNTPEVLEFGTFPRIGSTDTGDTIVFNEDANGDGQIDGITLTGLVLGSSNGTALPSGTSIYISSGTSAVNIYPSYSPLEADEHNPTIINLTLSPDNTATYERTGDLTIRISGGVDFNDLTLTWPIRVSPTLTPEDP